MAIIVDKVQKRKDIALACQDLFMQKSIVNVTISEIAKVAGIGKGTVYEYFKNKEDIVFEIINIRTLEHDNKKQKMMKEQKTVKDKTKAFFSFFYSKEEDDMVLRHFHKEFISISLVSENSEMFVYQSECYKKYNSWFEDIIQEAIDNNEIIKESKNLINGMFAVCDGMLILSFSTNVITNLEKEICDYFDELFNIIEIKK